MLTPQDILDISEPIEKVYIDVANALLINIAKHFKDVGPEATNDWQIQKLSELGQLNKESVQIIADLTGQAPQSVKEALEKTVSQATKDAEPILQDAAKNGVIGQATAENVLASENITTMLSAYNSQAAQKINLVNTTMLDSTLAQYKKVVTNTANVEQQLMATQQMLNSATGKVLLGTESRTQALRQSLKQVSEEGVAGFFDRAGRSWSPEAYINMDIRTTVHNTSIEATKIRAQDYGVSTFQVSAHSGARPLCYPYQGKFYSWDNSSGTFTDGNGKRHTYRPLSSTSYGEPAGLFGINCGHYPITMVPGYSIPRDQPIEDKELNDKIYAESQRQRYLEREVRSAKREAAMYDAAGDTEAFEKAAVKVKQKQADYNTFCKETGRTKRLDRTQVFEYNRSVSSKATAAAKRAETVKAAQEETKRLQILELEKQKSQKTAEIRELIKSDGTPKKLNVGKQNQHIRESKGYKEGKSYIYGDLNTAQELVDTYHGTGEFVLTRSGEWNHKEIITAKDSLGVVLFPDTKSDEETNRATIHYSKKGTHVVPTRREKKK